MQVSIIISTYGEKHWAELAEKRALQSAWGQGAYEVLKAHHPTGPIALARNQLATAAEGDWLCFLDADDELAPDYLGAMARALEQEGAKALTTALLLTPAVTYMRKSGRGGHGGYKGDAPHFNDRGIPLSQDNWLVVGTLIERDLFERIGGFHDAPHGFEDFGCWSKAWRAGAKIVKVPDAVYRAYVNPRSAHRTGWRDRKWQVETHNRVIAELDEWERQYKAALV